MLSSQESRDFSHESFNEIEFIAQVKGSGHQSIYTIDSIEFKTIGLREINILSDFPTTIIKNGYTITIPEPAVYIIQKILANQLGNL
jgi:hypothetical protein